MYWTGKKVCNDREILWDAMPRSSRVVLIFMYGWMMFLGVTFSAFNFSMSFQAQTPAQGVLSLERSIRFLAFGLTFILGGVCGLLWQEYLVFDLSRRTYFRHRGIGRWAKDVVSGDFADFSHIQIDGMNESGESSSESEGGITYVVSLVWAETVGRRGCRRFKLGGASYAAQAATLAAELAVPLNIPVQEKWLRGEKPTPAR